MHDNIHGWTVNPWYTRHNQTLLLLSIDRQILGNPSIIRRHSAALPLTSQDTDSLTGNNNTITRAGKP